MGIVRVFWSLLALALIVGSVAAAPARAQNAYIANAIDNTVSVIDTGTGAVTATFSVGISAFGVAVAPDGSKVYIASLSANSVAVIDTATHMVTATIAVSLPYGVAVTPDGSKLYVASALTNTIAVIDTATNAVTATIPVGLSPFGVAITPDGSTVYVANNTGRSGVSVIDTATGLVTNTIDVGVAPQAIAVTPDGGKVYVTVGGSVVVIATATGQVTATIPIGDESEAIAVTPDGTKVYVATFGRIVSVIDTATDTIIGAPIPVGEASQGIQVTPDGSKVYVTNGNSVSVSVIDTASNTVVGSPIRVGRAPASFGNFIGPARPTVTGISPAIVTAGGMPVRITGTNLAGALSVHFGSMLGTNIVANNGVGLTVTPPAGLIGLVDVTVTTPGGTSVVKPADRFNSAIAVPTLSLGSLLLLALGLALAARTILLRRRES